MKQAVLYCTCCDTLGAALPSQALRDVLAARSLYAMPIPVEPGDLRRYRHGTLSSEPDHAPVFMECSRLCRKTEAETAVKAAVDAGAEAIVAAACSLSARGREGRAHLSAFIPASIPVAWVDIRESCAWVHAASPTEALGKAADSICMSLAALKQKEPPSCEAKTDKPPRAPVLVVGGGPAGMSCAATLANMGVPAILAERRAEPGGMLPQLGKLFPHLTSGDDLLRDMKQRIRNADITLKTGATVTAVYAAEQGFTATLRDPDGECAVTASAVVLATGAVPVIPKGRFRHGKLKGVTSQMEMEILLAKVEREEESPDALPRQAVFLQCVAARDADNPYCSAVCCPTALKNALRLKALVPEGTVTVAHRNIVTPGIYMEELYRRTTAAGIALRDLDPAFAPEPVGADSLEGLRIRDALDGRETVLPADSLVCSTPLRPAPGTASLAQSLGLRRDDMGFICGREPILPLAPHRAGIYLCGSARWPATVEQSLEQGRAAAVRAAAFARGSAAAMNGPREDLPWAIRELLGLPPGNAARVREEACSRCGRCASACPYGALDLPEKGAMRVAASLCGRCGSCAAVCPSGAAALPGENIGAMRARIYEALGGETT